MVNHFFKTEIIVKPHSIITIKDTSKKLEDEQEIDNLLKKCFDREEEMMNFVDDGEDQQVDVEFGKFYAWRGPGPLRPSKSVRVTEPNNIPVLNQITLEFNLNKTTKRMYATQPSDEPVAKKKKIEPEIKKSIQKQPHKTDPSKKNKFLQNIKKTSTVLGASSSVNTTSTPLPQGSTKTKEFSTVQPNPSTTKAQTGASDSNTLSAKTVKPKPKANSLSQLSPSLPKFSDLKRDYQAPPSTSSAYPIENKPTPIMTPFDKITAKPIPSSPTQLSSIKPNLSAQLPPMTIPHSPSTSQIPQNIQDFSKSPISALKSNLTSTNSLSQSMINKIRDNLPAKPPAKPVIKKDDSSSTSTQKSATVKKPKGKWDDLASVNDLLVEFDAKYKLSSILTTELKKSMEKIASALLHTVSELPICLFDRLSTGCKLRSSQIRHHIVNIYLPSILKEFQLKVKVDLNQYERMSKSFQSVDKLTLSGPKKTLAINCATSLLALEYVTCHINSYDGHNFNTLLDSTIRNDALKKVVELFQHKVDIKRFKVLLSDEKRRAKESKLSPLLKETTMDNLPSSTFKKQPNTNTASQAPIAPIGNYINSPSPARPPQIFAPFPKSSQSPLKSIPPYAKYAKKKAQEEDIIDLTSK